MPSKADAETAKSYRDLLEDSSAPPARTLGAGDALRAYIGAFSARDADFMKRLFDSESLTEIPLLAPNRLFGIHEIERGHRAAFDTIAEAVFTPTERAFSLIDFFNRSSPHDRTYRWSCKARGKTIGGGRRHQRVP